VYIGNKYNNVEVLTIKNEDEKITEMNAMYDDLCIKIDEGKALNSYEQMAYDMISWLLFDSDMPELD